MINLAEGEVIKIMAENQGATKALVRMSGEECIAIGFHAFTPALRVGDQVVLNTTAVDLGLGTGGCHFVLYNKSRPGQPIAPGPGHIMKLRYTPLQFSVLSVEEEASPYHSLLENSSSLAGTPVVVGLLHSHLTPAVLALNWISNGRLRVAYLMTDGGALPISFSTQVQLLKDKNLLAGTVTVGQAFGGDLEAVNCYSGLLAAKTVIKADIIVVAMGPGIAGTNTKFGFSGIEQGAVVNAVLALGGRPVIIPRISFADPRTRHQGLSHHTLTILKNVILGTGWVGLPKVTPPENRLLKAQLQAAGLEEKYVFAEKTQHLLSEELSRSGLQVSSMGRCYREDPAFFGAAWASGLVAYDLFSGINADGN